MLRLKLFRLIVRLMPFFFWRNKTPQSLTLEEQVFSANNHRIELRIYRPQGEGPFPVILYFHGGGFILGSLNSCDPLCREIAANAGHIIVSVDYRLAPEHPFPAAAHDAVTALVWLAENGAGMGCDMNNMFIAGDSAGGNLAAVAAREARKTHPGLLRGQVLLFPVTHHYSHETASYREHLKTRSLNRATMVWFWDTYYQNNRILSEGEFTHPLSTPLAMEDHENLPPALIIVAEDDPLRDEAIAYAEKLQAADNDVTLSVYPGVEHGFIGYMGPTAEHRKGIMEISQWLKQYTIRA